MCVCFSTRDLNSFGNRKLDGVRIAEREDNILALHLRAIADADDIEILLESLGDARDGVRHQGARQTVKCALLFGFTLGDENAVLLFETEFRAAPHVHLALRALHFDRTVLDLHLHSGRHRNYFVSNSRHSRSIPRSIFANSSSYQTSQSISPPMPSLRADWPVIKPARSGKNRDAHSADHRTIRSFRRTAAIRAGKRASDR